MRFLAGYVNAFCSPVIFVVMSNDLRPGLRGSSPLAACCPSKFISRESTDARQETCALSATRARQPIGLPDGESDIDYRDRSDFENVPVVLWRIYQKTYSHIMEGEELK